MDLKLVSEIPIFKDLDGENLSEITKMSTHRIFNKDSYIFVENQVWDYLFVVLNGKVKVTTLSSDGKELILTVLRRNDFFGEMSLLDGNKQAYNVVALEKTELLLLGCAQFKKFIRSSPPLMMNLLHVIIKRFNQATRQISSLALFDVYGRVARFLMDVVMEEGTRTGKGEITIRRPTHQEIANRIGSTRESVTRTLKDIENRGLIRILGKRIIIREDLEDSLDGKK